MSSREEDRDYKAMMALDDANDCVGRGDNGQAAVHAQIATAEALLAIHEILVNIWHTQSGQ